MDFKHLRKREEKEVNEVVTEAEYTCDDLMNVFYDTLITTIKIKDLAEPDKQEDKTTIKIFFFFPNSQGNCCI